MYLSHDLESKNFHLKKKKKDERLKQQSCSNIYEGKEERLVLVREL